MLCKCPHPFPRFSSLYSTVLYGTLHMNLQNFKYFMKVFLILTKCSFSGTLPEDQVDRWLEPSDPHWYKSSKIAILSILGPSTINKICPGVSMNILYLFMELSQHHDKQWWTEYI
jgi:hypothetical protein